MAPKVFVVLTSKDKMARDDATPEQVEEAKPTGWYLPEFAHPYYELVGTVGTGKDKKELDTPQAEIVVASLKGGLAPLDEGSKAAFAQDHDSVEFLKKELWVKTAPLKDFLGKAAEFDALFYPGGHGPMFDLDVAEDSHKLIEEFYLAGKPVAAVCHGPIVFADVKVDGKPLLGGREATGFSNDEEAAVGLTNDMPRLLEDAIKQAGGKYVKAENLWEPKVVVDGQIITGQNPASAAGVGQALAKAIGL